MELNESMMKENKADGEIQAKTPSAEGTRKESEKVVPQNEEDDDELPKRLMTPRNL